VEYFQFCLATFVIHFTSYYFIIFIQISNMKKQFITCFLLFNIFFSFAQQKQLTMEDAMLRARTTLAPENLKQLQFIKGANDYAFLKKVNGIENFVKVSSTGNESVLLTLGTLNVYLHVPKIYIQCA